MWSKKYPCCQECSTTKRKHFGKGLCFTCYSKKRYRDIPKVKEEVKKRAKDYYKNNPDKIKERSRKRYYDNYNENLIYCKMYREEINYNGMREPVLKRDNYTCQKCGKSGDIVHHKDGNGRNSNDVNNEINNLITLCRSCHCIEHLPRLGTGKQG